MDIPGSTDRGEVITILNRHATLLAKRPKIPEVEAAFGRFADAVEANPTQNPADDLTSKLGRTYAELLRLLAVSEAEP